MRSKPKAKLLLVDDNPSNLVALEAVLDSPKYHLVEADNGARALELCFEHEFALIVLDIQMPGMDGFEVARKIKDTPNKDTPIIFVTAVYQDDPFVKRGFEAGAIDYFGKPFDPDILKAKVSIYTELYLRTKRLMETEKLLQTHAQVKTLLEALPIGVVITDAQAQIYEINDEASKILESLDLPRSGKFDQLHGWNSETGKEIKDHDWALQRALKQDETTKDELIDVETKTGSRKKIHYSVYPIHSKNGNVLGAVMVVQDFTDHQQIASNLHEKIKDLLRDAEQLQEATLNNQH